MYSKIIPALIAAAVLAVPAGAQKAARYLAHEAAIFRRAGRPGPYVVWR